MVLEFDSLQKEHFTSCDAYLIRPEPVGQFLLLDNSIRSC